MKRISVVIPMRNEADILERCLSAMEELDYPMELFEVVIVNDGSTDNTAELVKDRKWSFNHQYIETDGVGVSRARDIGFRRAKGGFIAFTDADCVVERNWLLRLSEPFDEETCSHWHLYAVERCLALRKKGYSIYAVPVEAYHRSPGYSMSPEYYTTMGAIMKKHSVPVVWTSLGFSTPYLPLGLQRRLKEFLMRL